MMTPYDKNETFQPNLIALCTVMLSASCAALFLRYFSNFTQSEYKFGLDDLFAGLTLPCIVAENALVYRLISLGLGKHAATVPPADLAKTPKIFFAVDFINNAAVALPKFSALFFYRRIFERQSKWFNYALWTVCFMNAGWLISAWLSTLFNCSPVRAAWEEVSGSHCSPQWDLLLGTAIPTITVDLLILILPLPRLWRLQVNAKRRLSVCFVFLCGYCVIIVSIGRLVALAKAGSHILDDLTWTTLGYIEWAQCEGPISLVSVCLPSILGLMKRARKEGIRSSKHQGRNTSVLAFASANRSNKGQFVRMDMYPSYDDASVV